MAEITITKENFDEEVRNYKGMPILLDLWAGWCGPCMMLAPVVEEVAEKLDGKLKVGKINVDEEPELAMAFRAESIPLLVVVKDGVIQKQAVGYRSKEDIYDLIGIYPDVK
jgi:thioredoxin 1